MKETLEAELYVEPFPLMVVKNFYNQNELDLIWKELDFYTEPNKLFEAKEYGGVVPEIAARDHSLKIIPLLENLLNESGEKLKNINFRKPQFSVFVYNSLFESQNSRSIL